MCTGRGDFCMKVPNFCLSYSWEEIMQALPPGRIYAKHNVSYSLGETMQNVLCINLS